MAYSSILSDPYCLALLRSDEIETLLLLQLLDRKPRRRLYVSRNGLLDIDAMPGQTFRRQFRFEKRDFSVLVKALQLPEYVTSAQGVRVSAREALCMCLRRLAYPNRLCDLQEYFGRHYSVISSVSNKVMLHIETKFGFLLNDLTCHRWLTPAHLRGMSDAVHRKGAPLQNCWAFIESTAQPICRPSEDQQIYFYARKGVHALKYQALMCPNGLICQLDGPYPGGRHNAGILRESQLYDKLEQLVQGSEFAVYGDPSYPLRLLLMTPYEGSELTKPQEGFNAGMNAVRQVVELGLGKVVAQFAFLDFGQNQRMLLQTVPRMYKVAVILANCHSCMYGNQVSTYFGLETPCLFDYLQPAGQ